MKPYLKNRVSIVSDGTLLGTAVRDADTGKMIRCTRVEITLDSTTALVSSAKLYCVGCGVEYDGDAELFCNRQTVWQKIVSFVRRVFG